MSATVTSASTVRPLDQIRDTPFVTWRREEVLAYALYIRDSMSRWEACTHNHPSGLVISTTPDPKASIRITDAALQVLFYSEKP